MSHASLLVVVPLQPLTLPPTAPICFPHQVPSAQFAEVPPLRERGDLPEEDMDVRGGGLLHDEHRRWGTWV